MVLREADYAVKALEELAKKEQIPAANFNGIDFAEQVTLGFYDFEEKKFNRKTFEPVEMGNLTGSIVWNGQNPSIHIYGATTDENFNAYGGHILELEVGTGSM
ncbi:MAG: PPC domain-containing DNA-binding protein [Sphingobacterium hotanense]